MKRFLFSVALVLALVLALGAVSALLAGGGKCTPGTGGCNPCPMTKAACASAKAQIQPATTASSDAACCPGGPASCPQPCCPTQGKDCGKKCSMGDSKSDCKASSAAEATKQTTVPVKTAARAVETKVQVASSTK